MECACLVTLLSMESVAKTVLVASWFLSGSSYTAV